MVKSYLYLVAIIICLNVSGQGRWKQAKDLKAADIILTANGNSIAINQIKQSYITLPVFNFKVGELHNYYVSEHGILVHNPDDCDPGPLNQEVYQIIWSENSISKNPKGWLQKRKVRKQLAEIAKRKKIFEARLKKSGHIDKVLEAAESQVQRSKDALRRARLVLVSTPKGTRERIAVELDVNTLSQQVNVQQARLDYLNSLARTFGE